MTVSHLSPSKKVLLGIQHLFAMFGATVLVPTLTGLNPSVALICAGIGTLIFHFCTGNRVPVFVGSSFAYIAALQVVIARYSEGDNHIPGIQAVSYTHLDVYKRQVKATGNRKDVVDFVNDIVIPVSSQKGNELPVSTFIGDRTDGTFPQGTAAFEKRGVAVDVPTWNPDNCIQCGFCSLVCPHAVIRPYAMTEEEAANAPAGQASAPMTGMPDMKFAIGISVLDCLNCGLCANVCPGKKGEKALTMVSLDSQREKQNGFNYLFDLPEKPEVLEKFKETTVKGSQFKQPLLEFSGACAGCGETRCV